MWYFTWILGVGFAVLLAILNAMWGENEEARRLAVAPAEISSPGQAQWPPQGRMRSGEAAPAPGVALLPLAIAIALTVLLTIYPPILTTPAGQADHAAATLALWAMSAGFIRGVGFVPRNRMLHIVFSTAACLVCLAASAAMIANHRIVP